MTTFIDQIPLGEKLSCLENVYSRAQCSTFDTSESSILCCHHLPLISCGHEDSLMYGVRCRQSSDICCEDSSVQQQFVRNGAIIMDRDMSEKDIVLSDFSEECGQVEGKRPESGYFSNNVELDCVGELIHDVNSSLCGQAYARENCSSSSAGGPKSDGSCYSGGDFFYEDDFSVQFDSNLRDISDHHLDNYGVSENVDGGCISEDHCLPFNNELYSISSSMDAFSDDREVMGYDKLFDSDMDHFHPPSPFRPFSDGSGLTASKHSLSHAAVVPVMPTSSSSTSCQKLDKGSSQSINSENLTTLDCSHNKDVYFLSFDASKEVESCSAINTLFTRHQQPSPKNGKGKVDEAENLPRTLNGHPADRLCLGSFSVAVDVSNEGLSPVKYENPSRCPFGTPSQSAHSSSQSSGIPRSSTNGSRCCVVSQGILQLGPQPKATLTTWSEVRNLKNFSKQLSHHILSPNSPPDANPVTCNSQHEYAIKQAKDQVTKATILSPHNGQSWNACCSPRSLTEISDSFHGKQHSAYILDMYHRLFRESFASSPMDIALIERILFRDQLSCSPTSTTHEDLVEVCLKSDEECFEKNHQINLKGVKDMASDAVLPSGESTAPYLQVCLRYGQSDFSSQFPLITADRGVQASYHQTREGGCILEQVSLQCSTKGMPQGSHVYGGSIKETDGWNKSRDIWSKQAEFPQRSTESESAVQRKHHDVGSGIAVDSESAAQRKHHDVGSGIAVDSAASDGRRSFYCANCSVCHRLPNLRFLSHPSFGTRCRPEGNRREFSSLFDPVRVPIMMVPVFEDSSNWFTMDHTPCHRKTLRTGSPRSRKAKDACCWSCKPGDWGNACKCNSNGTFSGQDRKCGEERLADTGLSPNWGNACKWDSNGTGQDRKCGEERLADTGLSPDLEQLLFSPSRIEGIDRMIGQLDACLTQDPKRDGFCKQKQTATFGDRQQKSCRWNIRQDNTCQDVNYHKTGCKNTGQGNECRERKCGMDFTGKTSQDDNCCDVKGCCRAGKFHSASDEICLWGTDRVPSHCPVCCAKKYCFSSCNVLRHGKCADVSHDIYGCADVQRLEDKKLGSTNRGTACNCLQQRSLRLFGASNDVENHVSLCPIPLCSRIRSSEFSNQTGIACQGHRGGRHFTRHDDLPPIYSCQEVSEDVCPFRQKSMSEVKSDKEIRQPCDEESFTNGCRTKQESKHVRFGYSLPSYSRKEACNGLSKNGDIPNPAHLSILGSSTGDGRSMLNASRNASSHCLNGVKLNGLSSGHGSVQACCHRPYLSGNLEKKVGILRDVARAAQTVIRFHNRPLQSSETESSLLELKALAHLCPAIEHLMLDGLKMSAPCLGTLDMLPLTVWKVTEMSAQKCIPFEPVLRGLAKKLRCMTELSSDREMFFAFLIGLLNCRLFNFWLDYMRRQDSLTECCYEEESILRLSSGVLAMEFSDMLFELQPLTFFSFQLKAGIIRSCFVHFGPSIGRVGDVTNPVVCPQNASISLSLLDMDSTFSRQQSAHSTVSDRFDVFMSSSKQSDMISVSSRWRDDLFSFPKHSGANTLCSDQRSPVHFDPDRAFLGDLLQHITDARSINREGESCFQPKTVLPTMSRTTAKLVSCDCSVECDDLCSTGCIVNCGERAVGQNKFTTLHTTGAVGIAQSCDSKLIDVSIVAEELGITTASYSTAVELSRLSVELANMGIIASKKVDAAIKPGAILQEEPDFSGITVFNNTISCSDEAATSSKNGEDITKTISTADIVRCGRTNVHPLLVREAVGGCSSCPEELEMPLLCNEVAQMDAVSTSEDQQKGCTIHTSLTETFSSSPGSFFTSTDFKVTCIHGSSNLLSSHSRAPLTLCSEIASSPQMTNVSAGVHGTGACDSTGGERLPTFSLGDNSTDTVGAMDVRCLRDTGRHPGCHGNRDEPTGASGRLAASAAVSLREKKEECRHCCVDQHQTRTVFNVDCVGDCLLCRTSPDVSGCNAHGSGQILGMNRPIEKDDEPVNKRLSLDLVQPMKQLSCDQEHPSRQLSRDHEQPNIQLSHDEEQPSRQLSCDQEKQSRDLSCDREQPMKQLSHDREPTNRQLTCVQKRPNRQLPCGKYRKKDATLYGEDIRNVSHSRWGRFQLMSRKPALNIISFFDRFLYSGDRLANRSGTRLDSSPPTADLHRHDDVACPNAEPVYHLSSVIDAATPSGTPHSQHFPPGSSRSNFPETGAVGVSRVRGLVSKAPSRIPILQPDFFRSVPSTVTRPPGFRHMIGAMSDDDVASCRPATKVSASSGLHHVVMGKIGDSLPAAQSPSLSSPTAVLISQPTHRVTISQRSVVGVSVNSSGLSTVSSSGFFVESRLRYSSSNNGIPSDRSYASGRSVFFGQLSNSAKDGRNHYSTSSSVVERCVHQRQTPSCRIASA